MTLDPEFAALIDAQLAKTRAVTWHKALEKAASMATERAQGCQKAYLDAMKVCDTFSGMQSKRLAEAYRDFAAALSLAADSPPTPIPHAEEAVDDQITGPAFYEI